MSTTKRSKKTVTARADIRGVDEVERATRESRDGFEALLASVEANEARELHEVERDIFGQLLVLGRAVLQRFLASKGAGRARAIEVGRIGSATTLPYHSEKTTQYLSIFGLIDIAQSYFWSWSGGVGGVAPLKSELNLPERRYSYVLQEWATLLAAEGAYDRVTELVEKVFRIKLWKQAAETIAREAGADVERFYVERKPPAARTEGEILVVGLDGKGVPMRKPGQTLDEIQRRKGERGNKKSMATVHTVYTVAPHERSARAVVAGLFRERRGDSAVDRAEPQNKHVRATLKGVDTAMEEIMRHVDQRDPSRTKTRVALVDGEHRLADRPEFGSDWIKILDIFHVSQKVWAAGTGTVLYGQGSPDTVGWVGANLTNLLRGKFNSVLACLKTERLKPNLSKTARETLRLVIHYFENNRDRMRYADYLRQGLPIATGVVEGACGSFVNDRAERSGMRWSRDGAEAVLELRAVLLNGHWEEFSEWRVRQERQRLYPDRIRRVA
jgi:hypothetical protein